MNQIIQELRFDEAFLEYLRYVKSQRPTIPEHVVDPDNTEEWKKLSAMAQGFDLCLTYFGEKPNE